MEFEWDENKNEANQSKHGVGFDAVREFSWADSIRMNRTRHLDEEVRFAAVGPMNGKLFTVIYTWRGSVRRIIRFRRSNASEEKAYEKTIP